MTRPETHRSLLSQPNCGNCCHSKVVPFKRDLLCFHGDQIKEYPGTDYIELDGEDLSLLEGDAYDRIWAGRVVDETEVCDEWKGE